MSSTAATLAGRLAAEAIMQDSCTITAGAAEQVYDPGTDAYVTPAGASRYSGACRVKPQDAGREVEAGAETVSLWPFLVSIPMSVTGVELDDLVTITASPLDPSLVGLVLRVRQVAQGSHLTARRIACELASS